MRKTTFILYPWENEIATGTCVDRNAAAGWIQEVDRRNDAQTRITREMPPEQYYGG